MGRRTEEDGSASATMTASPGTASQPDTPSTARLARSRKPILLAPLLAALLAPHLGLAERTSDYYVYAPVIDVQPVMTRRTVERPVRDCTSAAHRYDDDRFYRDEHHGGGYLLQGIFGGLVGGLIGNQFGGGNGRKAMTVLGAVAGSSIAREAARQNDHRRYRTCTTHWREETVDEIHAYDVTYEYAGQQFSKRTTEHPGDSVRVRVAVSPDPGDG